MERNTNPQFSKAHLTTLNLNNFKMTEAMRFKLLHRGPLEWHYHRTKFHENLQNGSKVISGGHTDTHRHTGDLISLLPFLESRVKKLLHRNYSNWGGRIVQCQLGQ
jgi:hypothetical protein